MDKSEVLKIIKAVNRNYPTWSKYYVQWEQEKEWRKSAYLMKQCEKAISQACIESDCQKLTIFAIFKELYKRKGAVEK